MDQQFTNVDEVLRTGTTVTTEWTTVLEMSSLDVNGVLNLELANAGATNALGDTRIQVKVHPAGTYKSVLSGSDFASSDIPRLLHSSGSMNTIAAAGEEMIQARLWGCYAVRVQCKAAATTTEVKAYARICLQ